MKYKGKDSRWEHELCTGVLRNVPYHEVVIPYTIESNYSVDYGPIKKGKNVIYIEAKGFFRTTQEAAKYKWIREAMKPNEELVFLFQSPNKPLKWARPRKAGGKMTHCEWAERHGFRWFDEISIKTIL